MGPLEGASYNEAGSHPTEVGRDAMWWPVSRVAVGPRADVCLSCGEKANDRRYRRPAHTCSESSHEDHTYLNYGGNCRQAFDSTSDILAGRSRC